MTFLLFVLIFRAIILSSAVLAEPSKATDEPYPWEGECDGSMLQWFQKKVGEMKGEMKAVMEKQIHDVKEECQKQIHSVKEECKERLNSFERESKKTKKRVDELESRSRSQSFASNDSFTSLSSLSPSLHSSPSANGLEVEIKLKLHPTPPTLDRTYSSPSIDVFVKRRLSVDKAKSQILPTMYEVH